MNQIPDKLKDFYDSIENLNSLTIWNIHRELKVTAKIEGDWKKKVIVERKSLNYNLNKGELLTNVQVTDSQGQITSIGLEKEDIEYLKERLDFTQNSWLKSRYSHLLWQEIRHNKYAEVAIDNYIATINRIKAEESRELPIILSAILFISKKTKKKLEVAKEVAITLINDLPNWFKPNILNSILENNIFSKEELNDIALKVPSWVEDENPVSYFANKQKLEAGIQLYKLLELPLNQLYELLAKNEDLILEQHQEDTDFVKYTTIGTKAKYLRLAGKLEEAEDNLKEYNRLKQTVKLGKVSWQLGEKETEMFNKYLDMKSKVILDMPTEGVLAFFSINEDILVDPEENLKNAEKTIKNSIRSLFSTSVFDINSNFKNLEDSEKIDKEVIQSYTISHGVKCFSLFLKVFVDGILTGKLNYYKIYDFFESQTWYGTKFKRGMTDNEIDQNSNWLTMLAPGIHNLIAQFELSVLMNTNKINNFILAMDSLTLKFEGALRDFIRLSGGNTSTSKRGEIKEQLLEELLENDTTKKYFTEKDIELFKFTFTQKGKNLRNNIAHSFLQFSDYNLQAVTLVFFCILRLGKYTFNEKTSS
ncbi:DUF4209 domain-containing protein [Tenacibaculum mesophilum]|uniref:DUF4209 domain-containing protein n=1 Tax=Tenacibaculum sp. Pbs-1 TaxID=3238748 RepID=A0AB33L1R2_9FLAO|nr:DUF4209 domain-containing protein [Tenacibaculum mesophilum]GFD80818.1 hypothetical protein KUL118_36800 [Tenacibaculum sp. KUL118]